VLSHELQINADRFLPVDGALIPSGEVANVEETPFDFRVARPIGERIREHHPQLQLGHGYDHNYCLQSHGAAKPSLAARLYDRTSGRAMDLLTDQPGLQFYSGNFLHGGIPGKGGRLYRQADGLCLEPQAWPNSPNRSDFPVSILAKGDVYSHTTSFMFSTD
jgi:aldose 1-epimerase